LGLLPQAGVDSAAEQASRAERLVRRGGQCVRAEGAADRSDDPPEDGLRSPPGQLLEDDRADERTEVPAGGAIVAPTALSLITTNFPEGPPRNRAVGVYSAMSIGGIAVGLLAGGLLTSYLSWRWVLFVNVPIGIAVALLAPRALSESQRYPGRFDLPGAITGTSGIVALVYGLSSAGTTPDGVSHWGDTKVLASLPAAAVLLAAFGVIEARSKHALMPMRIFRNGSRSGVYLVTLCIGTALTGMFFFLTIFVQTIARVSISLSTTQIMGTLALFAHPTPGIIHLVAVVMIRVTREDLAGAEPMPGYDQGG
jgi:hypothetical protein